MHIYVQLAEPYWRSIGRKELSLEVEESSRVGDLVSLFHRAYPPLGREIDEAAPMIFVDDVQAEPGTPLREGCRVHLVWPVAGG